MGWVHCLLASQGEASWFQVELDTPWGCAPGKGCLSILPSLFLLTGDKYFRVKYHAVRASHFSGLWRKARCPALKASVAPQAQEKLTLGGDL